MTEAVIAPPVVPAAPSAPAVSVAPAAPAPAPAESLIHGSPAAPAGTVGPGEQAAPATPSVDPFAELLQHVPEKFHVKQGDKLDPSASLAKALEHRAHLEKRLGAGDLPPKKVEEYQWTPPDTMQGFEIDESRTAAFKDQALKHGFTTDQFKFVMDSYIAAVPDLMQGAAKMSANQARAELQKVWTAPGDLEIGIGNAERAIKALPQDVQDAAREFGTDPAFIRAMAHFGAMTREDRPPANPNPPAVSGDDIKALERHPAYMDQKHPEHASVNAKVSAYYTRVHGSQPI